MGIKTSEDLIKRSDAITAVAQLCAWHGSEGAWVLQEDVIEALENVTPDGIKSCDNCRFIDCESYEYPCDCCTVEALLWEPMPQQGQCDKCKWWEDDTDFCYSKADSDDHACHFEPKDEPNSSEKPNNCEMKNYCDDCLWNCDGKYDEVDDSQKKCVYDSRRDYEYDKALEQMERKDDE